MRLRSFNARFSYVLCLLLLCATRTVDAAESSVSQIADEEHVRIERIAHNTAGQAYSGTHPVTLKYLGLDGDLLYSEIMTKVEFQAGKFDVTLGQGDFAPDLPYQDLNALFDDHPKLLLEILIDGQPMAPKMGVLPRGHSLKSHLVARGLGGDDDQPHWKHYDIANDSTAVQSAQLNPAGLEKQGAASASDNSFRKRPYTIPMIGPFSSRAVRDLPKVVQRPPQVEREINRPRHESMVDAQGRPFGTGGPRQNDRLATVSEESQQAGLATPALGTSFEGIANPQGYLPPDTEGAVGPNHYVQAVNVSFAIYDKVGNLLSGPVATNSLWSGFGGVCESNNSGDAIFMYDEQADRWLLSQFAVQSTYTVCFAVSKTPDPLGEYWLYEVDTPRFPDYYKLGVWPDADNNAYFMGTNSGYQGQYDVFALDRASMLAGTTARPMQLFQNFVNLMMPADLDAWQSGAGAPPQGSPGLFYTMRDGGESYLGSPPTDSIDVWDFDVDWDTPANTTFTRVEVITPADGLAEFNWTICGFFEGNCAGGNAIPQPGTSQKLDSASWWPMQRLVYQNYGSHESLFGAWTVDVLASGDRAAPRWFELRKSGGNWVIHDQGTHSPDAIHRWMPSIAADISGNIAIGYSRGDANNYASIYYATRDATDPPGTLQAEALLQAASGAQTSTSGRWGDYSSMELDPSDGCTFWFTTEYLATTGGAPWRTRVGSFSLPTCGGPRFSLNCTPSAFTASEGEDKVSSCTVSAFNGYAATVNLSCADLPAGIGCAFSNASDTPPFSSDLTISVGSAATLGDNVFQVEASDTASTKTVTMNVAVLPIGSNGPQEAQYDGVLGAPLCATPGSECDSASLLAGRANLGPEPNQPNTLDACTDGTSGAYLTDESIERLTVRNIDGFSNFAEGATVEIEAQVFAWSTGASDTLDLYYTADANNPNWIYLGSQVPPAGGTQTLTQQYTLPAGGLQAVRANFRYEGSPSPCSGGNWDDADDLVFAVEVPVQCTVNADCDNGLYCDGTEICNAGICESGSAPVCNNGLYCDGTESCNEASDSCDAGTPVTCDNGLFCDGTESCNEATDSCDAGTPVVCDDGLFCNGTDTCNESTDSCDVGAPPSVDDGVSCTVDSCDEATDSVVNAPSNSLCDNGLFCDGSETCDAVNGCQAGTAPSASDGVSCTVDSCNEATDSIVNTPDDSLCDNGLFCDGTETCDAVNDCQAGTAQCTGANEACDEAADQCVFSACNNNGICEAGEDCGNCANDCISGTTAGASCGNGVCEAGDGENATLCPADCNGIVSGKPANRFSCGFGDSSNNNSVGCSDPRCTTGGYACTEEPVEPVSYCCGDATCSGPEDSSSCSLDCGEPPPEPVCGNGIIETGEICDGAALSGDTCQDLGYSGGTLACQSDCLAYDVSACTGGSTITISDLIAFKVKGVQNVDVFWSGANSASVDIYRDGSLLGGMPTANDGEYTDNIGQKGGGSYTYEVCEAGTSTCSLPASVTF